MEKFLRRVNQKFQYMLDQIGQFFRVLVTPVEIEKPKNKEKRSGTGKMERFTKMAKHVLNAAEHGTKELGHYAIEPEHVLLGIMREKNCFAYQVLTALQFDENELMEQVKQYKPTNHSNWLSAVDLSQTTKKVLELSVDAARRVGHHYIDSEHLLIGIMRVNKPEITSLLAHFGTDAKTVIKHTEAVLKQRNNSKKDNQ